MYQLTTLVYAGDLGSDLFFLQGLTT
jgi:hypothetical protein